MASPIVILQNADMNTLAAARLNTLEDARHRTFLTADIHGPAPRHEFLDEGVRPSDACAPPDADELARGGNASSVGTIGGEGSNGAMDAADANGAIGGIVAIDGIDAADGTVGAHSLHARTLADMFGGIDAACSATAEASDMSLTPVSGSGRRAGVSDARDRLRCTFTLGHAVVVITLLVAALCASLTLLLQQAGNYAAFQRQSLALGEDSSISTSSAVKEPDVVSAPQSGESEPAESETQHDEAVDSEATNQSRNEDAAATNTAESEPLIDLNTAGTAELMTISGIGPVTAESIVTYRKEQGRFKTVDQLLDVSGIGLKKLESIRPYVRVE